MKVVKLELQLSRPANVALLYFYDKGLTTEMRKVFGIGFTDIIYIFRGGAMEEYRPTIDNKLIARVFINLLKNNFSKVEQVMTSFAENYDLMEKYLMQSKKLKKIRISSIVKLVSNFNEVYQKVWPGVVYAFWTPLWFKSSKLQKNEKARLDYIIKMRHQRDLEYVHAQFFYENIIHYLHWKLKINKKLLEVANPLELVKLLKNKRNNHDFILKLAKRKEICLLVNRKIIPVDNISVVEQYLQKNKFKLLIKKRIGNVALIKGQPAYQGKRVGVVTILKSKSDMSQVKQGDIIVSPMTTPYFISALKRAGAIVTDEGGVICHAAIVAREMKKPCIVGTKIATRVLKNGDRVEVDANKGIVKKV